MVTAPDIPGHRVGSVLGAGGFATVYRCWQVAVGREVAVKVDNRALLSERDRRRFFREVTAAGRLSGHPHVIEVATVSAGCPAASAGVAILPVSVRTFDQPTVAANPAVTRLCSMRVLLQSRQPVAGRLPARAWRIEVLPPSEAAFDTGARAYRCIANDYGNEPSTSQFRR